MDATKEPSSNPTNPASRADLDTPEPRDLLVHLREWLNYHRELHTQHFGESDQSGHPHGYAGVVIPGWDVRQRLDEIQASLDALRNCDDELLEALKEMRDVNALLLAALAEEAEADCVDRVLRHVPEKYEGFGKRANAAIAEAESREA